MAGGDQDRRVKAGDQDRRVKAGCQDRDQDSKVKAGGQQSITEVGDQENRAEVGAQESRMKAEDQKKSMKGGDQEISMKAENQVSRVKTKNLENREQVGDQENIVEAGAQKSRLKVGDQASRVRSGDQGSSLNAGHQERKTKMADEESRVKAVNQDSRLEVGDGETTMNLLKTEKLTPSSVRENYEPEIITVESEYESSVHLGQSYEVSYHAGDEAFKLGHVSEVKEDAVGKLSDDFREGAVTDELSQTLFMFEELAHGVLPRHTAVKLLGKHSMFSGFFDSQIGESLTIQEGIDEGVMDEKLIQMIFTSENSVSGVFDSHQNRILSIKDASNAGLLDAETTMRILEGQVVTGGIIDLKRNKRLSVTLASNLGIVDSSYQAELIKLEKALKGKSTDEATLVKLVGLQMETQGIRDPKTKEPVTIVELIERGLVSKESAECVLTKQIAEGGIVHQPSGIRLSVAKSLEHGLIDQDLAQDLAEMESVGQHRYVNSSTTEPLSLKQAVSLSLASAKCNITVQEVEALSKGVLDPISDQKPFFAEAAEPGLLSNTVVQEAASSLYFRGGIIDPECPSILPYLELIKKCKIDLESGQRYLEVTPSGAVVKAVSGEVLPLAATVSTSKVDLKSTLRILKDKADSGSDFQIGKDKILSLLLASEQGLVGEEKIRNTAEKLDGAILEPLCGGRMPLMQDVSDELMIQSSTPYIESHLSLGTESEMENIKATRAFSVGGTLVVQDEMTLSSIQVVTQEIIENEGLVDIKQMPKALLSMNQASLPPEEPVLSLATQIIKVNSASMEGVESEVFQHVTEPTADEQAHGDTPSPASQTYLMRSIAIDAIERAGTLKTAHAVMEEMQEELHEHSSVHIEGKPEESQLLQTIDMNFEKQTSCADRSSPSKLQKSTNEKLSKEKESLTQKEPHMAVEHALEKQIQQQLSKENQLQQLEKCPSEEISPLLRFTTDKQLSQEEMSQPTPLLGKHSVKEPRVQQNVHENAKSLTLKHPKRHDTYSKEKTVVQLDELATQKLNQQAKKSFLQTQSNISAKIKMSPKAEELPNEKMLLQQETLKTDNPCSAAVYHLGKKVNELQEKSKKSKQEKSSTKHRQQEHKKMLEQSKPPLSEYSQQVPKYLTEMQANDNNSPAVQQRPASENTACDKKLQQPEASNRNTLKKAVFATEKHPKQPKQHFSQIRPLPEQQQMYSLEIQTQSKSDISSTESLEMMRSSKDQQPQEKTKKYTLSKPFLEKELSKQHETLYLEEFQIIKPLHEERISVEKQLNPPKSSTEETHDEKCMESATVRLPTIPEEYTRDKHLKQSQTTIEKQPLQPVPLSCDSLPQQSKEPPHDKLFQEPNESVIDRLFQKPDVPSKGTQPQELGQLLHQSEPIPRHNLLQQQNTPDWKSSSDQQSQYSVASLSENLLPQSEESLKEKQSQGREQSFRHQLPLQSRPSSSDKQLKEASSKKQSQQEVPIRGLPHYESEESSEAPQYSSKDRLLQQPEESSIDYEPQQENQGKLRIDKQPQQLKGSLVQTSAQQPEESICNMSQQLEESTKNKSHLQQVHLPYDFPDFVSQETLSKMGTENALSGMKESISTHIEGLQISQQGKEVSALQSSLGERNAISGHSQDLWPEQDSKSMVAIATASQAQEAALEYSKVLQTTTKHPKELCLEHDEKLLSYLSHMRDIEVRMRPPLQQSGAEPVPVQDLVVQAEKLRLELENLILPVHRELGLVSQIVDCQPHDVPKQLLKALEKDAKNVKKTFKSIMETSQAWLHELCTAAQAEKSKIQGEEQRLLNELQRLLAWVDETTQSVDSKDNVSLRLIQQYYKALRPAMSDTRQQLDTAAYDIQFFISEHAQDLTPKQSRQLLQLLNQLQRGFRELSERLAAKEEGVELRIKQAESCAVVQNLQEQQAARSQKLEELSGWLRQTEDLLSEDQAAAESKDLSALQQRQSSIGALQKDMQAQSATFARTIQDMEEFLEENRTKMSPGELQLLQEKLSQTKERFQALQQRSTGVQKELESAVTTVKLQETQKVKAAEELEEKQSKIDSLMGWMASLKEDGPLSKVRVQPVSRSTTSKTITDGPVRSTCTSDTPLDQQLELMKASHQELLSQQQNLIHETQSAQAFLDQHGHSLPPEERQRLQSRLSDLKEQYAASLSQSETQLRQTQVLRDELQKFLHEHSEFEAWLQHSEQELEDLHKGGGDPTSVRPVLRRQGSFAEDVISHKGDLRYITISGQKVVELDKAAGKEGPESMAPSAASVVKQKLEDAQTRYHALQTKCSQLGTHLGLLLDRSQQFQDISDGLHSWLEKTEVSVGQAFGEPIASDAGALQKQLENTANVQGDLAEHQVQVDKMQKAAQVLLDILGEPAPDHKHIQTTRDAIMSRYHLMSRQMSERTDHLLKCMAQSQSVQEGVDSLLQWMDGMEKSIQGPKLTSTSPSSIQEALALSSKLKQDITSRSSSLDTTGEMVERFLQSADTVTAQALEGKLTEVKQRFDKVCRQQQEQEVALKELLPKAELYEQLSGTLQDFTHSRARMLAAGNSPDEDITHFCQQVKELNAALRQQKENMNALEQVAVNLSASPFHTDPSQYLQQIQNLKKDFTELQDVARNREKEAISCQQRLADFRSLVGLVKKWLSDTERNTPCVDTSLGMQELETRIKQTKALLEQWADKRFQVEMISEQGTTLENLIMEITAPDVQNKTGSSLPSSGGSSGSVNGYHTCKDLTEIQCDVSDVNQRYESLGSVLRDHHDKLSAMQKQIHEIQEETLSLLQWLESKEQILLSLDSSPTGTQAEQTKALLAELEQNSGKVEQLKLSLRSLLESHPHSPEAGSWKTMLEDLDGRWKKAHQVTVARQKELEEVANQLASFQNAESQLRPWLTEKELMMSVLGPLSIEPNMLNAQKQQVQFMLKEFDTRSQQHEQLNQAARVILSSGDGTAPIDHVQLQLCEVNNKWQELTQRLNSRSEQIDQAIIMSTQYQDVLRALSEKVRTAEQKLSAQPALSTQPEVVKQQLQETSQLRSEVAALEQDVAEAKGLCDELSQLIREQYLKDELKKRLETVAMPLRGMEELAVDRMNRLQTTLASSQQFQQMFDELRTWLDGKVAQQAQSFPISAKLDQLQSQIHQQEEFQKSLNQHSGAYEMIVGEGESLLHSTQPGEEKATLQNQLASLKVHWEELFKQATERNTMLKDCLQKAQKYQQYVQELLPWVEDCSTWVAELEVSLDHAQLETSLLRAKVLQSDVEKRHTSLEMLNSAADLLIDSSQTDEDCIREEKATLNQKMDALMEELQAKTASIEEMSHRLKEFKDSFKNIEKKLEGAQHQLEIYEALGPQACSSKNLEKMRSQQEILRALEPQVDYLNDLIHGLVADSPQGSDSSKLLDEAEIMQQDFGHVKQKVDECCSVLESKLQGIGQFHSHVREMFSQLADWDDEFDSMGAVGRDVDSLQSQIEDLQRFLSKLQELKADIGDSEEQCRQMLESEASPDLLGLKRELQTLNKQCSKLTERGKSRHEQLETTLTRVKDFYSKLKEMKQLMAAAESDPALRGTVGSEVDVINQQLNAFKTFQKERVEPLQSRLQLVNGLGQGLIQSAEKSSDVHSLEHDTEELSIQWNTLSKKVAERVAQLQEALLHCGKFQDALEPLLSWLTDTEELIANQKPPSAEYKVVKAQIQEQKLLQRLLDDRRATVEMIQTEGGRIAHSAEPADREKIHQHLESLEGQWTRLRGQASARKKQLDDILVLAQQFHESVEPMSDWLSAMEKKLANSEPIGTQTSKIQQQITRHKALEEEVGSREEGVHLAMSLGDSLSSLSSPADQSLLADRLASLLARYDEVRDRCGRKGLLLEQALVNARLFGEDEVEVLNWLGEVEDKLSMAAVKDYRRDVLHAQHALQLALNEDILCRKKNVDQAVKNGQALLKQTTGEEVLLIQEKLDGIKTRYSEITAVSAKALRILEQARQLATKFQSTHEELSSWLLKVEEALASSGGQSPVGEQIPQFQQRQKELKKEVMEKRLVLDTVNEVSSALLELVPWRAREGLDKLVSEANDQYRSVSDTIGQRVEQIDAAIQRSQQYEQAADAELAWVAETKRKLLALGPIRLEQDQTTAQLQVQKAFTIDIIRHKDSMDEILKQQDEILGSCGEENKANLQVKTQLLQQQYGEVSHLNSERYTGLERAQALVAQFWETHAELSPWLEETQSMIELLPPPAVDPDILRQQQEDMRLFRESIAEHKPHIDKLLKIGPQLQKLNEEEGLMVRDRYSSAESSYTRIREEVRQRAILLDEAVAQAAQFHDKIEPMLETLEALATRLQSAPLIPAEVDKIRECITENKNNLMELEKLQPSFEALKRRGQELIGRSEGAEKDPSVKAIQDKLDQMLFLWGDIRARVEERELKFLDVLELAEKFWYDMAALLATLKDTQDIIHDLESPGIDPSLIKQQVEAAEAIKEETDGLHEELEFIRILGTDLIFACGETEKPEVKKSIDEMNTAWENLNRTWKDRLDRLEEAMLSAVQYQDSLQAMFDWLDNAVIKLCDMSPVGTDLDTVKDQIHEMKEFKLEVYQQQIDMERLSHQGELMLKKATDQTDRDIIKDPLTELRHLWDNLGEKINDRQHTLEAALLALGQFQHALSEVMSWLTHTEELLNSQRPISSDPRLLEVELAKHHVLKNDVLAHQNTVETVSDAGKELLQSSAGDDASSLRNRLQVLNDCWASVLQKTEEREQQLELALQQAQGFYGEIEDILQWLIRTESVLSSSKAIGGMPETAREQLAAHMDLYAEFKKTEEMYRQLLDKGRLMLPNREDPASESSSEQNVAILERKWQTVSTKMEERKCKLEEALTMACDFQNSLQDFINWLTQAEQNLNMAPPASLILDTVLFQIDEHKMFVNEVNQHRDHIIELDKTGNQLKFLSQKQDVVLIKNLLVSVQTRWEKVVQRSVERGRALDDARKRAKQFHEAWKKLIDWLEDAENRLDTDVEISNDPDKIKLQLTKHKEFQKTLGSKQPVYDTTIRTGRAIKEKAQLADDVQKLDHLLGEVRDRWDTVCGKSVERQHKLEEALLFSGQFMDALQALVDWLYKVEPQLAEDQPVHGDLDLVMNLMDTHKGFQKELGKRTGSVQALKRSARELLDTSRDDIAWVKVQLQELSIRWDTVCKLSVSKQTRLELALKQAEEFRAAVHVLLEWLSEAEQTLRFRGSLPDDVEALQSLIDLHKEFMQKVEEKRVDVNTATGLGEAILAVCHPDCVTTIKHWNTIIRARFEEVLTWAKQHQQRLETAHAELVSNADLLEELLAWIQWAETTLMQRDQDPIPQNIDQVKALISEHQLFMEEMTQKQPDVDKITKTYKRKPTEPEKARSNRKSLSQVPPLPMPPISQSDTKNPRINQLSARWQQVWLLALERQRKLNDVLDRLEELKEFANFDFDVWRKKYMRWMNHKKSRVMDFFRRIDKDQDGKITRQEFIDGILASKFPTTKLEMTAVADIFDRDGDGYIDYYEFVAALHPNKDAYRPTTDADKIEDEVTRQVAQCKCAKRFQVEQIGENKYRFFLGNQFGDSQQLRLVRILRSTVMVRVGGGWMALDEFLVKNDPCRVHHPGCKMKRSESSSSIIIQSPIARGRTNLELREKFILPEGASQGMTPFRSRGRRSKPSSRTASPTRSSSSASQSNHSCTSMPSSPATPASGAKTPLQPFRSYEKPWLANSKTGTPARGSEFSDFQMPYEVTPQSAKLKRPTFHSSRTSLTGDAACCATPVSSSAKPSRTDPKKTTSRPASCTGSRAGSRAGSRGSSRRGSDASDFDLLETQSACSDTSESSAQGGNSSSRRGAAKPSKIPTMSKKSTTVTPPKTAGTKR